MATFTFRDIAAGRCSPAPLAVAESALAALQAANAVYLSENVARVMATLRRLGHTNTPHARGLACVLCAACAHHRITHPFAPSDTATTWKHVQDVVEAWFSEQDKPMETMLADI